tara:strand:- start:2835 stop:3536 length:702 start_codon:yes stop_codon:yes gene_type:complete
MRFETELCHIDSTRTIVKVTAWSKEISLGSTVAEASNVDQAENKAIEKLKDRLSNQSPNLSRKNIDFDNNESNIVKQSLPNNIENISKTGIKNKDHVNLPAVPEDWSKELSIIDNKLSNLSWQREQENIYLQKLLGHNNRSRITSYKELKIYLSSLDKVSPGTSPEDIDFSKNNLINITSILLDKLNWDNSKGREFITTNFNCNTRSELDQRQLLEFILLLEDLLSENNNTIN